MRKRNEEDEFVVEEQEEDNSLLGKALGNMTDTRKKLYFAIFMVVIVFIIGSIAYERVEGWDTVTAVYFMSATMTTVGYGDIAPKTELGRILTIIFVWVGVSLGLYLIYTISEFREKEVDEHLKKFMGRMEEHGRKIKI